MRGDKMPPICHKNGLEIVEEPKLTRLNKFDNMLIARKIPFMFICQLPVSRMEALKGKSTLVPIQEEDIRGTVEAGQRLPRTPDDAGLVTYELRKKQEYRQTVGRPQLVRPKWLEEALVVLKKAGNPFYQTEFDRLEDYRSRCMEDNPKGAGVVFPELADCDEDMDMSEDDEMKAWFAAERRYNEKEDPVKRNQLVEVEQSACLIRNNPEMERRAEDSVVSVAPGEGRRPEGWLHEKTWDVQTHPRLHNPDGSNGLGQEGRSEKLTDSEYFKSRVKNVDGKWAEDFSYVAASVIYMEKKQIRSNTNMSFLNGKKVVKDGGKVSIEHHDAWSVLRGIKNSPKFWHDKKGEVIATMDNFGPFHFFWTVTCGERRWDAVLAVLARSFPEVEDVIYNLLRHGETEVKIKLKEKEEEITLEEFLESINESRHELLKKNVLAVTRYFDMRVKSFIKNIVMGGTNPMAVILYTYRIEFQKRGHPHAHGCLWIDINKMDEKFPGLKSAFNSLRHDKSLKQVDTDTDDSRLKEVQALTNWIDYFVTCSLNENRVGKRAVEIAQDTQGHGHTRRCHKKSDDCG